MDMLISDRGEAEISNRVKDILRMYVIEDFQSEPYQHQQNFFEKQMVAGDQKIMYHHDNETYVRLNDSVGRHRQETTSTIHVRVQRSTSKYPNSRPTAVAMHWNI